MESRMPYIVLLVLTLFVLGIYLYQNRRLEAFDNTQPLMPLVNLVDGDLHLIEDNNPSLIKTPIFNYPLTTISSISGNDASASSNSNSKVYISVFMHDAFQYNTTKYTPLGQYIRVSSHPLDISDINSNLMVDIRSKQCLNYLCSGSYYPVEYKLIWTSDIIPESGSIFSIWRPVPPAGCVALGDVIVSGVSKPAREYISCLPATMLTQTGLSNGILWHSKNDMGLDGYCWSAGNFDTFIASNTYSATMPELGLVYNFNKQVINNNLINNNLTKPTYDNNNGVHV
jgi:hypothetical protein